jgi:phosphate:Na+ symporter
MTNIYLFLAGAALGCTLLVAGIQLVSNNLLELAEFPIFSLLKPLREKDNKTFFKGLMVSALSGSTLTTISTLIGLVNAGLVKVRAGFLFMAGSHLGPIVLLIFYSFLGFRSALVFLSLAMITQFLVRTQYGHWFQNTFGLLFGLGLVSLGRYFLMDGLTFFSGLDQQFLGSLTDGPYALSLLTGIVVGSILSYAFRSSVIAILLLMVVRDSAFFSLGLLYPAVVGVHALGFFPSYNLSKEGNVYSHRVVIGQFFISLIGLIVGALILLILPWNSQTGDGMHLLYFFILIRVVSVGLFLLFLSPLRNLIKKAWPEKDHLSPKRLTQLGRSMDMVPAMSLIQGSFHLAKFKNIVDRMFKVTEQYLREGASSGRVLAKIKDYERITDNMHREIHRFLTLLAENQLTQNQSRTLMQYLKIADELESIADFLDKIASYNTRYIQSGENVKWRDDFMLYFNEIQQFYFLVTENAPILPEVDHKKINILAQKLKISAESLREEHLKRLSSVDGSALSLMTYSDMVVCLRKIRGHTLKLHQALS